MLPTPFLGGGGYKQFEIVFVLTLTLESLFSESPLVVETDYKYGFFYCS